MHTYAEQIAAYEAKRASTAAQMKAIMDKSAEAGETLDAAEQEEFDTAAKDIDAIDAQIKRLKSMEALNSTLAKPVAGENAEEGAATRADPRVKAAPVGKLLPGLGFTRYVKALALSRGSATEAYEIAKANDQWRRETPDVIDVLQPAVQNAIKTAAAAGNTTDSTWAAPLVQYQNLTNEFVEYLRPLTIIGRLNLRQVPFKVKLPRQTAASSVNWVGEGKVKPVSSLAFDSITLDHAKIAGIIALTDELVRLSSPSADRLVRDDLAASIIQFMDSQFVDPSKAANDVSPASVTNGVTPVTASGTTLDALKADVQTLVMSFIDGNMSLANAAWIMTQQQAMAISMMENALGQRAYPNMTVNGGVFEGLPVIASENLPGTGGSPTDGYPLILIKQDDVMLADEGQVMIDVSKEASIQMDTSPDSPSTGSTNLVSLWQHNMIGVRAERMITWAKRRSDAVGFIQHAKYRA